jgi:small subunit ribosomal protein S21
MIKIKVKPGEPFEKAMRRFKRKVETEGIMKTLKRKRYFLKPSERKKEKRKLAEKRRRKAAQKNFR